MSEKPRDLNSPSDAPESDPAPLVVVEAGPGVARCDPTGGWCAPADITCACGSTDWPHDCTLPPPSLPALDLATWLTVPQMLAQLRRLCADRQAEDVHGGRTDAEPIWPSEILAILDARQLR